VAVSNLQYTSLYSLLYHDEKGESLQVEKLPHSLPSAVALSFNPQRAQQLILATREHHIKIYQIKKQVFTHDFSFLGSHRNKDFLIDKLVVSPNGKYLAARKVNELMIFDLDSKMDFAAIPSLPGAVNCIFSKDNDQLIILERKGAILSYSMLDFQIYQLGKYSGNCIGLAIDSNTLHIIYHHKVDLFDIENRNFISMDKLRSGPILFSGIINDKEMVTVNWKFNEFLQRLPSPFYRHKYGT